MTFNPRDEDYRGVQLKRMQEAAKEATALFDRCMIKLSTGNTMLRRELAAWKEKYGRDE